MDTQSSVLTIPRSADDATGAPTLTVGGRLVSIFDGPTTHVLVHMDAGGPVYAAKVRHEIFSVTNASVNFGLLLRQGAAPEAYPPVRALAVLIDTATFEVDRGNGDGRRLRRTVRQALTSLTQAGVDYLGQCPAPMLDASGVLRCPEHHYTGDDAKRLWNEVVSLGAYRGVVRRWRIAGGTVAEVR